MARRWQGSRGCPTRRRRGRSRRRWRRPGRSWARWRPRSRRGSRHGRRAAAARSWALLDRPTLRSRRPPGGGLGGEEVDVDELWRRTAGELAAMIAKQEVSSAEVVEAHLARIDALNPEINAVTMVLADEARAGAAVADRAVA